MPKASDAPSNDGERHGEPEHRDETEEEHGVEDVARVRRLSQQLEQDRDQDRAEHGAGLAAEPAEDHHRVDA